MFSVLNCIFVEHDLRLVVVAALICATACSAAFGFQLKSLKSSGSATRLAWMALTGLVAGSGVWATHFIAMLAYQPSLDMGYEPAETAASLATAIIGMTLGFALPVLQRGRAVAIAGGALTGLSVGAMHFMGIEAIRIQAGIVWAEPFVVAAMLVGTAGAAAAFWSSTRLSGRAGWVVPAALLVLAIVGLHFTAMAAVKLVPDPTVAMPATLIDRSALAVATVTLAAVILGAAGTLIWMEQLGRRSTLQGLRGALDVVPAALSFYDPSGRLVSWNRAFSDLMDRSGILPVVGMARRDLIQAVLRHGWRTADGREFLQGRDVAPGVASAAQDLRTPEGRWIQHETFVTGDGGGVTVMTDITEQRETARILSEARDAAEAANRAKSQFLANMSHEIRTPLNGVLGVADVLGTTRLNGKQRELVGVIRSSGALLNALLTDLLDLARVEAGVAELRPQPAALADVADSVRGLFASRAEQKGLKLTLDVASDAAGHVACDAMRLRQVLGNLVSNAVKFTEAGEVTIRLRRDGDRVSFAVIDTGVGFDETMKATLFGRFQQADDSSTRRHGGAGLGLAICKEYVALMGGELDGTSTPGQGSTFGFSLDLPPLAGEPPVAIAAPESVAVEPGRFRVLVVDDNAVNRQVLGLILDTVGIAHADAEDGRVGLEAAMTGGFDAILMDIQMPVMDGFEATRRIREWEASSGRPRLPIYIVSANCLQDHVDAGVQAGADGHLAKPVSVPQLLGALEPHATAAALAA